MAGLVVYFYLRSTLPDCCGERVVAGIDHEVEIIRDSWGMPHVYSKSETDAAFAIGYATAQDRLFQMDLLRRVCQGRLSEWFGPDALPSDRFARVIGFHRQAQKNLNHLPAESIEVIEAYSAGVNAYAARRGTNLPLEYKLLKQTFDEWRPEDTDTKEVGSTAADPTRAWAVLPKAAILAVCHVSFEARLKNSRSLSFDPGHPPSM